MTSENTASCLGSRSFPSSSTWWPLIAGTSSRANKDKK